MVQETDTGPHQDEERGERVGAGEVAQRGNDGHHRAEEGERH